MTATANQSRTPDAVTVTFRKMELGEFQVPKHWAMDSAIISHFWNVLSCGFPPVELFFIKAARAFVDQIEDPKLSREVRAFVAQEGHHAHHHRQFNASLKSEGLGLERYDGWFVSVIDGMWKVASPKTRLGFTAAFEHLAAVFSAHYVEQTHVSHKVSPEIDALWTWHALEELEHKSVCFDLLAAVDGSETRRVLTMLVIFPVVFSLVIASQVDLTRRDIGWPSLRECALGYRYLFGHRGVFQRVLSEVVNYVRPGFHPWQSDTSALIARHRPRFDRYVRAQPATSQHAEKEMTNASAA